MRTSRKTAFIAAAITVMVLSCKKNDLSVNNNAALSPAPVLPETPYDYPETSNDQKAALGRVLFYDRNLSFNNSIACASCHQQEKAFCDNLQFSVGLENGRTRRNSPSIFAKTGRMFWDGRASDINDLVLRPVKNHVEMKFDNLTGLAKKLASIEYYPNLFKKAYGTSNIDSTRIQDALAEFLKNFNFSDNKFSRSRKGKEKLTATEELGRTVFFSKGKCFNCHHVDGNGFEPGPNDSLHFGGGYGNTDMGFNIGLDLYYTDKGIGEISGNDFDEGVFMVPVLLNVEYTAPYMHDGRYKTLEEVIEHYNSGIQNHKNLSSFLRDNNIFENLNIMTIQEFLAKYDTNHNGQIDEFEIPQSEPVKLGLTQSEKAGLVAFLRTLSDPSILREPKYSNPFALK